MLGLQYKGKLKAKYVDFSFHKFLKLISWKCNFGLLGYLSIFEESGLNSQQGPEMFVYSTASTPSLGPVKWVLGTLSPGVKQPAPEADRSPPSSAEVKNGGATTQLPPPQYIFVAWCLIN
jgi:hypothetical protein